MSPRPPRPPVDADNPAVPPRRLAPVDDPPATPTGPSGLPAVSDPPRSLASHLGASDQPDTPGPGRPTGATGATGLVSTMLAGRRRVDPMLDLVQLGASVPRHHKEALRLLSFARNRRIQDLVTEALAEYIGDDLLTEALHAVHPDLDT